MEKKTMIKLAAAAWGLAVAVNENRLRHQRGGTATPQPMEPPWEAQARHLLSAPPARPAATTPAATSASFADSLIKQNRDNSRRMVDIYKQQTPKWWLGPGNF